MMLCLFDKDSEHTPYIDDKDQLNEDALYFAVDREREDIVLFLSKPSNFDFSAAVARPCCDQAPLQLAIDRYLWIPVLVAVGIGFGVQNSHKGLLRFSGRR
jgi:hypothetical protein